MKRPAGFTFTRRRWVQVLWWEGMIGLVQHIHPRRRCRLALWLALKALRGQTYEVEVADFNGYRRMIGVTTDEMR